MDFKIKNYTMFLAVLLSVQLVTPESFSQGSVQRPSRQAALDAFAKGDYEKAYIEFDVLLSNYSKDPLYKYYKGVCLVKLNRDPQYAQEYLLDALNGALDIKSIPDDVWFYLARSQQMSGMYAEAIKSYNTFENKAGKRNAREMNVPVFIQESKEGKGKISERSRVTEPTVAEITAASIEKDAPPEIKTPQNSSLQPAEKPLPRKEEIPEDYDKVLTEALNYQVKADSITAIASDAKTKLGKLPADQQRNEKVRIAEMEAQSADYQKLADKKFGSGDKNVTVQQSTAKQSPGSVQQNVKGPVSTFRIETNQAKAANQVITFETPLPEGLVYRIQVGVFSKPLPPSFFKGITPVSGYRVQGSEATKYFVGLFRKISDANSALLQVRQTGFRDAFITAVFDGKPVSLERAAILEREWGGQPLNNTVNTQKPAEPTVSTLVYRVEVIRSSKPVADDVAETYRTLAGNRGLEVLGADDGNFVYLIGKFITFESASEYSDLLNRNGYREAKVVAYLGNKEIPIATAKQLFESQK